MSDSPTFRFRCTSCNVVLQAPQSMSARRIKCPKCGEPVVVPSPRAAACEQRVVKAIQDEALPTVINLDHLFRTSLRIYRTNWSRIVMIWLVATVGQFVASVLGSFVGWVISFTGIALLAMAANMIAQSATSIFVWAGASMVLLNIVRGREISLKQFISGGSYVFRTIIASLLYWGVLLLILFGFPFAAIQFAPLVIGSTMLYLLVIGVSILVAAVVGLVLGLMFGQYPWLIIDQELGPIASLNSSRRITSGNKWYLLVLILAAICIAAAGPLAIRWTMHSMSATMQLTALLLYLYLVAFTVAPLFYLLWCVAYLQMSGAKPLAQPAGETSPTVGWWPSSGLVSAGVVGVGLVVALLPMTLSGLSSYLWKNELEQPVDVSRSGVPAQNSPIPDPSRSSPRFVAINSNSKSPSSRSQGEYIA